MTSRLKVNLVDPKFDRIALLAPYLAPRQDVLTSLGLVLQHVDLREDRAPFLHCLALRWEIERSTSEVVFLGRTLDLGELGQYRFESTLGLTHSRGLTTLSQVVQVVASEMQFFRDVTAELDRLWKRVELGTFQEPPAACFAAPVYHYSPPASKTTSAWRADRPGGQE